MCVLSLRIISSEPCSRKVMISPLWSAIDKCQSCECALMSPAFMEFGIFVSLVKRVVMLASSILELVSDIFLWNVKVRDG